MPGVVRQSDCLVSSSVPAAVDAGVRMRSRLAVGARTDSANGVDAGARSRGGTGA